MKHEIIGQTVPAVEVELDKGEAMFTQSGAMAWMDPSIKGESKICLLYTSDAADD